MTKRDGYMLPAVIFFIIFVVALGMAAMESGLFEGKAALRRDNRESAFYLAEAGAERAVAHIMANPAWKPDGQQTLGAGYFEVELLTLDGDPFEAPVFADGRVQSTGVVGDVEETVEVTLGTGSPDHVWSMGIFGRDRVLIDNNARIASYDSSVWFFPHGYRGHTASVELIELQPQGQIRGDAFVATGGEINRPGNVTGNVDLNAALPEHLTEMEDVVIPEHLIGLDYPTADSFTVVQGGFSLDGNGNFEIDGDSIVEMDAGQYRFSSFRIVGTSTLYLNETEMYVEDEVWLSGTPQWVMRENTVLYMGEGSQIRLDGDASIYHVVIKEDQPFEWIQSADPTKFMVLSASDRDLAIQLQNAPDKDGVVGVVGIFYVPHGVVDLTTNTHVYGSIVAKEIVLGPNSRLLYDMRLHDPVSGAPPAGELTVRSWGKEGWDVWREVEGN